MRRQHFLRPSHFAASLVVHSGTPPDSPFLPWPAGIPLPLWATTFPLAAAPFTALRFVVSWFSCASFCASPFGLVFPCWWCCWVSWLSLAALPLGLVWVLVLVSPPPLLFAFGLFVLSLLLSRCPPLSRVLWWVSFRVPFVCSPFFLCWPFFAPLCSPRFPFSIEGLHPHAFLFPSYFPSGFLLPFRMASFISLLS